LRCGTFVSLSSCSPGYYCRWPSLKHKAPARSLLPAKTAHLLPVQSVPVLAEATAASRPRVRGRVERSRQSSDRTRHEFCFHQRRRPNADRRNKYGRSDLQGRHILHRRRALRRLPSPWGRAVMGCLRGNDHSNERASTGGCANVHRRPPARSGARQRSSLGQYRQSCVPLPRHSVVRQDQAGLLHVRGASAGARGQAGSRKSLHFVRALLLKIWRLQ
jgi:hypothetical protein